MYTLLKNNMVITGPRDWNPKYFQHFLSSDCFIEANLPADFNGNMDFGNGVKLVETTSDPVPTIDPAFETLSGPQLYFAEDGSHHSKYIAQLHSTETIKSNLLQTLAANRFVKETTPIGPTDINGKSIILFTEREARNLYVQALLLTDNTYTADWKFPNGFFTLNRGDLAAIVQTIQTHVQQCFTWEALKQTEIESCTTSEQLRQIDLIS